MARSLLEAEAALHRSKDVDFMTAKIATARFYADHVLPETDLQRTRIMDGADSLLAAVF